MNKDDFLHQFLGCKSVTYTWVKMFLLIIFVAEQGRKGYQSTTTQVSAHEVVCHYHFVVLKQLVNDMLFFTTWNDLSCNTLP